MAYDLSRLTDAATELLQHASDLAGGEYECGSSTNDRLIEEFDGAVRDFVGHLIRTAGVRPDCRDIFALRRAFEQKRQDNRASFHPTRPDFPAMIAEVARAKSEVRVAGKSFGQE